MSKASVIKKKSREFYKRIKRQSRRTRATVKGEGIGMDAEGKTPLKGNSEVTRWRW